MNLFSFLAIFNYYYYICGNKREYSFKFLKLTFMKILTEQFRGKEISIVLNDVGQLSISLDDIIIVTPDGENVAVALMDAILTIKRTIVQLT